jgi:hypothetical protein
MAGVSIGGLQVYNPLATANDPNNSSAFTNAFHTLHPGGVVHNAPNFSALQQASPSSAPAAPAAAAPDTNQNITTAYAPAPAAPKLAQSTIDAILGSVGNQVTANETEFNNAQSQNATADATATNVYNGQLHDNSSGRATAIQNAEQAGAQGGQGLRSILASMGALGGTGQELANRAVANTTNNDIGGADHNFQTNATNINQAHTNYINAAGARDTTLKNNLTSDNNSAHAGAYQTIADQARSLGDMSTFNKYLPMATAATAPRLALAPAGTVFNPASINSYAPTSGLTVGNRASVAPSAGSGPVPVNAAIDISKKSGA